MKPFIFRFFCLLLISFSVNIASQAQIGGMGAGKQMPKMGKMYGKVIDGSTGKPIDIATVLLMQKQKGKQILVKGSQTDANGEFSLDQLPMMGQFELIISAIGYKEHRQPEAFDMAALIKAGGNMKGGQGGEISSIPDGASAALNALNKDLGNIRMEKPSQSLEGVTIKAAIPTFVLKGEKKIFNVDQNLTSQGGTASDVMKNVPGVLVDADNKVTIRNSAPQILIDGRQSPLSLDQIPADVIETVEVITNPSAKFDAEGGVGGILNIVLKKNKKKGYNGSVRANADSYGGAGFGGDLNARSGKVNISLNTNANLRRNRTYAITDRTDFYQNPDIRTYQDDLNKNNGGFFFGRLGLDYFITNRTTLSIAGTKTHGEFKPDDNIDITIDSLYSTGIQNSWGTRRTAGNNSFDMNGGQFGIKHIFPKAGEEWTFDATVNAGKNKNDNRFTTDYFGDVSKNNALSSTKQRTAGNGTNNFITLQSDYTHPFTDKSKLDVGLKASLRFVESNVYNYRDSLGTFIEINNQNSDYKNTDQVYAAYGSYSGNINADNRFQIGLRAESSYYEGSLTKRDTAFTIEYPVSLFPSVFYSRKLPQDQQLQFSYRRGINRPNFFQVLPFTDYTDPLNIRRGNPALQPEFTQSVELNYMKNFSRSNYVMVSLYERHSDNLITNFQSLEINPFTNAQAVVISYINANSSDKYGVELTANWELQKWWTITPNINIYNATLNTGLNNDSKTTYLSGFGKVNNQFRFAKKWSAQLSGVYQSRTNLLPDTKNEGWGGGRGMFGPQFTSSTQGYLGANWSVDASIRKSFLKNDAASLSLSINDIFRTGKTIQHSENEFFVQDYSRLVNPQRVRLNFNWRFGKMDTDLFRRKNIKGQMEGMQDAAGMGM